MDDDDEDSSSSREGAISFGGLSVRKEMLLAWLFRLVLLVAMLWASNNFVSKKEYSEDKRQSEERREMILVSLGKVNETLTRIDEKMKNDIRQDKALEDLDKRVRAVEIEIKR